MGERGSGCLFDHDRPKVSERRVLRRRGDALVGQHAADQHRVDVQATENYLEVRLKERAEALFLDDPVPLFDAQTVENLVAPGADA